MQKNNLLSDKSILIIDPDLKKENDKTFCFWATETDEIFKDFESIISNQWNNIQVNDFEAQSILPLKYCHISSKDLYNSVRNLMEINNIVFLQANVDDLVSNDNRFIVNTSKGSFSSEWVFNSIPKRWSSVTNEKFNISQSFVGFKIQLSDSEFKDDTYRMMDFRVDQSQATQFIYILPYDSKHALVELTRFGKLVIEENEAKLELDKYIKSHFGNYKTIDVEKGVIPMSSSLPKAKEIDKCVNIGTRAGSVKPSTGYAFKTMYNHAVDICKNSQLNKSVFKRNKRFLFYDQLLLIILTLWSNKGRFVFERLFQVKSSSFVLRFLDEKTTLKEEFGMFGKLPVGLFLKATFIWSYWRFKSFIIPILMIAYVLIFDNTASDVKVLTIQTHESIVLVFGLFALGIPHGALDHLTESLFSSTKISFQFVATYLLLMVPIFLLWLVSPMVGLFFFIFYSSWHFGQTDFKTWGIEHNFFALLWGGVLLLFMFLTHFVEFNLILDVLGVETIDDFEYRYLLSILIMCPFVLYALVKQKWKWILSLLFLFFAQRVSLITAFGIYFIFQHSRFGWLHLQNKLQLNNIQMFVKALPFNLGAILIYWLVFVKMNYSFQENIAYFFVFLSCISFPHVFCMTFFYKKFGIKRNVNQD
jgi:lycopene beta-cyclase